MAKAITDGSGSSDGRVRRDGSRAVVALPLASIALAAAGFAALATVWLTSGGRVDLPWAPTLGIRLTFAVDGLGALYGLLATGVGAVVFAYSLRYLPLHLRHQGRPFTEAARFYAFLVLFMGSMVGMATAQDGILLFVFWDLTAISSYFLIGYDQDDDEDRHAALMALLVTGISAVLLFVGVLLLEHRYGTFSIPEVLAAAEGDRLTTSAAVLIAIAGLAKSAQVPLHFWLPRAMVAPTPVSAYLHSAAMVAAGVFLLSRFWPLLAASGDVLDGLVAVGIASMAVGGVLALTRDGLKQVLAYSTVAQYGYVVFLLGLGTAKGAVAASFYVLVHALAKCALFLTAGAVTVTTGEYRLSRIGGLLRRRPVLAAASAVAGAGLVALPPTAGFFADELFFEAARGRHAALGAVALGSAVLTFAYVARLWTGIFLGDPRPGRDRPLPHLLVAPVAVLALALLVLGFAVSPLVRLARDAAGATVGRPVELALAYHLDTRPENLMALAAWMLGGLILLTERRWRPLALLAARLGELAGPEQGYTNGLRGVNALSDRIHGIEVRDLRTRVVAVLVPAGALVALGIVVTPTADAYALGTVRSDDVPLVLVLVLAAVTALATTFPREHVTLALILSSLGFTLAVAYAFFGAPDVALVAVLVETIIALAFLGVLALLPRRVLRREAQVQTSRGRRLRDPLVGIVSGGFAFFVVWSALSRPAPEESVATELARLTPEAHAEAVVTAILADFRGLDTLVEITVVGVALLAIVSLLRRSSA